MDIAFNTCFMLRLASDYFTCNTFWNGADSAGESILSYYDWLMALINTVIDTLIRGVFALLSL